jgi:hypothetical protein
MMLNIIERQIFLFYSIQKYKYFHVLEANFEVDNSYDIFIQNNTNIITKCLSFKLFLNLTMYNGTNRHENFFIIHDVSFKILKILFKIQDVIQNTPDTVICKTMCPIMKLSF